MAQILDGNRIRDEILNECRPRVEKLAALGRPPGLAVVLVGHNPASEIYVRSKVKTSREMGIHGETLTPPENVTTEELLAIVDDLNRRSDIDGILVQMPLPPQVDSKRVLLAVSPAKDVDGFHPCNVGNLVTGRPGPKSCTPAGIIELLKRYRIPIAGRRAVVVGRSDIVGKPVAMMLLHENATVTICHSKTPDLPSVCREGDILVAAIGRAALITAEYIKPGATVIDVGMNRLDRRSDVERIFSAGRPGAAQKLDAFDRKGTLLLGDVHPLDVAETAAAYTPVPGGVGPLTIAMLMVNTIESAERRIGAC
jgi:methylenetetrahydrofolate dehydrogenase (NADP+)/methenyltetrahydrofolate cyclohydrolase